MAGRKSTDWIAAAAGLVLADHAPDLTLVYLPHLDYDPQRFGPAGTDMPQRVKELDDACAPLLDAAAKRGAQVWVVSEYGHCDVTRHVTPNRLLRQAGLLEARSGPFGEQLDLFASRAVAVCDHQLAHVYVPDAADIPAVKGVFQSVKGIARVLAGEERAALRLAHSRSGEIILVAEPDCWFAYPFWLDDAVAPDYAPAVAIHHKPGFDPCELFFDPGLWFPKLHAARRLLGKKLGFRTIFDVVPLDPGIVRGSHGLAAADPLDRPVLIGQGSSPGPSVPMVDVRDLILGALGLD
jgi:predicted AlkP superfamily pyrophosphatase or phosphodiesterase